MREAKLALIWIIAGSKARSLYRTIITSSIGGGLYGSAQWMPAPTGALSGMTRPPGETCVRAGPVKSAPWRICEAGYRERGPHEQSARCDVRSTYCIFPAAAAVRLYRRGPGVKGRHREHLVEAQGVRGIGGVQDLSSRTLRRLEEDSAQPHDPGRAGQRRRHHHRFRREDDSRGSAGPR